MGLFTYRIMEGTAKDVQNSFSTFKGTSKNTTFLQLNNKPVRIVFTKPINIREGDQILVAGRKTFDGTFKAFAYRNVSKGITAKTSLIILPLLKFFYLAVVLFVLDRVLLRNAFFNSELPYILGGILLFMLIRQFLTVAKLKFMRVQRKNDLHHTKLSETPPLPSVTLDTMTSSPPYTDASFSSQTNSLAVGSS